MDPRTLTEIVLPNTQITELGSFEKFGLVTRVDLSLNRLCFARQVTGLFGAAPSLKDLNLAGNPICTTSNYRLFMIHNLPNLEVLDGSYDTPHSSSNSISSPLYLSIHLLTLFSFFSTVSEVTSQEREMAEKVIGRGEKIEASTAREGEEEEAAEIALLNEEASRTRIDPELKKRTAMEEQQRLYEAETAEAEKIAALLGQPLGTTPIDDRSSAKEAEEAAKKEKKEREAREKAEKKAEKDREERAQKEAKAAAKATSDAAKAVEKKAKDEADTARKQEEAKKKLEAAEKTKKEKEEKEAKAAAAKRTEAAPAPTPAPAPVTNEKPIAQPAKATSAVETVETKDKANLSFTDARTGLSITTSLSDAERVRSEPIVQPQAVPKRQTATEESIFGSDSIHRDLDLSSLPSAPGQKAKLSLFGDDDDDDLFFKKADTISNRSTTSSAASTTTTTAKKTTASQSLFGEDDDDLMAMLSKKPSKPTASSTSKKASDDIFATLDDGPAKKAAAPAKKSSMFDDNFDVDSFISSTKSSGGLFDD